MNKRKQAIIKTQFWNSFTVFLSRICHTLLWPLTHLHRNTDHSDLLPLTHLPASLLMCCVLSLRSVWTSCEYSITRSPGEGAGLVFHSLWATWCGSWILQIPCKGSKSSWPLTISPPPGPFLNCSSYSQCLRQCSNNTVVLSDANHTVGESAGFTRMNIQTNLNGWADIIPYIFSKRITKPDIPKTRTLSESNNNK